MRATGLLAFDVGGTEIKSAVVIQESIQAGRPKEVLRIPTPRNAARPGGAIIDAIAGLARTFQSRHPDLRFEAAGLVVPGIVDDVSGVGVYSANLGWRDFPFASEARRVLGLPVAFGHDVTAAGLAEFKFGKAKAAQNVLVLIAGTGIAGAVFSNGQAIRSGGYAGELGHCLVPDPEHPGSVVKLESIASAAAVAQRYATLSGHRVPGSKEVLDLADRGDLIALRVWNDCIEALAFNIAQVVAIVAPEIVILGGGLSQAGPRLVEPLKQALEDTVGILRLPKLLPAELGSEAGLTGAVMMARSLGRETPGNEPGS